MDITAKLIKPPPPCEHVVIEYQTEKGTLRRIHTVKELQDSLFADSVDEAEKLLFGQIKRVILENSSKTLAEIKTIVEQEVFKV